MGRWAGVAVAVLVAGCGGTEAGGDWRWELPEGFPEPWVPADNPMSEVKVELGRRLFFDPRLSVNRIESCGSCHEQRFAFADPLPRALGTTGEQHRRSSMGLTNVAYLPTLTWANPELPRLEEQALVPIFGDDPVELGMAGREEDLLDRLAADDLYRELFPAAFPREDEALSIVNVGKAIAAFERTLISGDSPWDRHRRGEPDALSPEARRGMDLFFSDEIGCHRCHGGFNFTGAVTWKGKESPDLLFANTGLYDVDGAGSYPDIDQGLFETTGVPADMGKFRVPTLRNVAVTAPFMHDGSIGTLEQVIDDHYARGGRLVTAQYAGDGRDNPYKSPLIGGFAITPGERDDLIAFLRALTDRAFLTDPRFSDPFP